MLEVGVGEGSRDGIPKKVGEVAGVVGEAARGGNVNEPWEGYMGGSRDVERGAFTN